ncbi:hypothetical protein GLOIN_2v1587537 [Rhizophagus clarus]|uniref:Uncharacterized protein n=1 Tax=Rhizophagus clarus TaxID=94130 RepID=A0A8H3LNZ1_9GLOM|nr:hypothetical protein GLOIN_2v1587537 [Rhizophagus clarus]
MRCTTCFEGFGTNITVESLDSFKETCGSYFDKASPPPSTTSTLSSSPLPPPPLPSLPPPKPTETQEQIPNQPLFCVVDQISLEPLSEHKTNLSGTEPLPAFGKIGEIGNGI